MSSAYVIYARKSSESEDRQVLSIDSQIRELQALAARQGLPVSTVLTESKSAKAPGRPGFNQLMREVSRGKVRGILCWKMDRLARNHLDTGMVLQALKDQQLERVVTSDRSYSGDGNDRFFGSFELGMATKYIDDLSANVKRGIRERLLRGWKSSMPPLGYLNDAATKTIVIDPIRFPLVRRMWDLLLTGTMRPEQIRLIANNEWGFRTRRHKRIGDKPLSRAGIYRLFADPFYMGINRLRDGRSFPGAHRPMVSLEEFQRAQGLIKRSDRTRPIRREFAYTGFIKCGNCGGSVTAEEHIKPSGRRYVYYHCGRQKSGVRCREPFVREEALEAQIASALERVAIPEPVLEWLFKRARTSLARDDQRREHVQIALKQTLEGIKRQEENLVSLRVRDLLDDQDFITRKQSLAERRMALELRLKAAERSETPVTTDVEATFRFAAKAAEMFRSGTTVQRRKILEAVGSNHMLTSRKVALGLAIPFQEIADSRASFNWRATWDVVRKWFEEKTEYFALPDLSEPNDSHTMPRNADAA